MKSKVLKLFAANTFSYLLVGLSFIAYSRLLSPSEFGTYGAAFALASMLALVLDGGIKTTIIKMSRELTDAEEVTILCLMLCGAGLITLLFALLQSPMLRWKPQLAADYHFAVLFVGSALIFYPLVTLPTARLERRLDYGHIAWIESTSMLLERGAPAIFLIAFHSGVYAFFWALLLSRSFRLCALSIFHYPAIWRFSFRTVHEAFHLLHEGSWIQLGSLANVVRDNLPLLLVGPFFGKVWIGNYTWALQVCQISSQAFAQISARVSLPIFAQQNDFEARWPSYLQQIRLLATLTAPVLCAVWLILPSVNTRLFHGKWAPALALVPLLFLRMLPGLATTPLGPLVLVHCGGFIYAKLSCIWTTCEFLAALLCLYCIGPTGLAWSYAFMVWVGLGLMLSPLSEARRHLTGPLITQILRRPSLAFSVIAALSLAFVLRDVSSKYGDNIWLFGTLASVIVLAAYCLEPEMRQLVRNAKA
ncbi:MAG TPA: oligosaccharide flippase family protein [Terriglobales bacterium]|nr:oligosaccharide flippase family protein [Terriglobales bacterium]